MKKRLFFDMDNVLVDFQSGLDKVDEETKNQYRAKTPNDKDRLDEIPGLFGLMDPMPGAIEAVHKLAEKYDVFMLSLQASVRRLRRSVRRRWRWKRYLRHSLPLRRRDKVLQG